MAIKPSHILGMNSRNSYTKLNPSASKQFGFSKIKTKNLLDEHGITTAQVYQVITSRRELEEVEWLNMPTPFVVKPASGSAGKGIILIKERLQNAEKFRDSQGTTLTPEDLELHVENILDGEFSTWGTNHQAIVEEMIPPHPSLAKYAYKGTPDIRVVVFNSVPVMAMARIPTKDSEGKANLDKGAIGLGIDMATGITIHGIYGKAEHITHFPGSKKKVNGILIPRWNEVLETAVQAANAAGYHFMGADLFIHPEKGPMIVELNGFPGLSIQLANAAGLKRRLERVEGLDVRDAKHGVKIAQALFAESFADKILAERGMKIISTREVIEVLDENKKRQATTARVSTARFRSAISQKFAESLGLVDIEDLLWQQQESLEGKVPVVEVTLYLDGQKIKTAMVVTKRLNTTKHKIELGRNDLQGFVVNPSEESE
jgi:alpha-L-glutamate ligase-like protein